MAQRIAHDGTVCACSISKSVGSVDVDGSHVIPHGIAGDVAATERILR
jgi:hypothetical protein